MRHFVTLNITNLIGCILEKHQQELYARATLLPRYVTKSKYVTSYWGNHHYTLNFPSIF
jgi:arylsulfatase A-like enzyme